jgi:hypothetical protein
MSTGNWHCDPIVLRRYVSGDADAVSSASVEQHLIRCAACRADLTPLVDPDQLARAWTGVREEIARAPLPVPLRLLRRAGLREEDAALLNASRTLYVPWILVTVALCVVAVAASMPGDQLGQALYLLVAPLVPVLGVAFAFHTTDPMVELTNATAYSKLRLVLLRTMAVIVTTVPLVVGMGALVAGIGWLSVAWLGPAFGLTLLTLVGLTWWRPVPVSSVIGAGWAIVVSVGYRHHDVAAAIRLDVQIWYLVLGAVTAVALAVRIRSAHTPGGYA